MANSITQFASDPVLREYANGKARQVISSVADFIAPTVEVNSLKGKFKAYDEKSRFRIPQTRREFGGRATTITFGASDSDYNCTPHALDVPADILEQVEASDYGIDLMKEGADLAAEVGALSHEKNVITDALAAVGAGENLDFVGGDDPVDVIDGKILDVIKFCGYGGLMKVGLLFGALAWKMLKNHPLVRARFTLGTGTTIPNITEQMASGLFLGNPDVRSCLLVEDTAHEGQEQNLDWLLGTGVLIFARNPNPSRRDPSFMKTFRLRGQWMVPGVYERDDGRVQVVKMDWSEDIKVVNSAAAKRVNFVDNSPSSPS